MDREEGIERSKGSSVAAWPPSSTFRFGGRVRARRWQRHEDGVAAVGKVQRGVELWMEAAVVWRGMGGLGGAFIGGGPVHGGRGVRGS